MKSVTIRTSLLHACYLTYKSFALMFNFCSAILPIYSYFTCSFSQWYVW